MFDIKDFGGLLIAQGRTLDSIRYPIFCEIIGNEYDVTNETGLKTAIRRIMTGEYKSVAVLDSFDCAYYGCFDYDDLTEYMLERGIIYEI